MKNILIRCDASKRIGLGHVTRCLVLAKEFQKKNCTVYFAMKNYQLGIEKVRDENFSIVLFDESLSYNDWILKVADEKNIDIFIGDIRDGFPTQTIKTLKTKKILTVAIDEPSEYAKECDMCFYPPHASIDEKLYKGQVFQGFEYVILREEFYMQYEKKEHKILNILVMMGGTDAYNLTYKIVKQLVDLKKKMNIKVIINKNHPDYDKIENIDKNISIYSDIKNMAEFLQEIDFGIISFGVSAYELLAMQIPALHICLDEEHWSASEMFKDNYSSKRHNKDSIVLALDDFNLKLDNVKINKNLAVNKILKRLE